uniref:Globin family profile domain-containing protein n=1 Tax=Acrobeloides nanus TaxID=290746 RepID=A0A914E7N9_9BILA
MFVQTLSMCIESINNTDAMAGRLQKIGEKHVQYAHRGFKPIFWDIFLDALEKGLSNHIHSFKQIDDKILQETIIVWRKLANFIISNMKRGYVQQLVKDFKEQDGSLGEWSKKHPCFNEK